MLRRGSVARARERTSQEERAARAWLNQSTHYDNPGLLCLPQGSIHSTVPFDGVTRLHILGNFTSAMRALTASPDRPIANCQRTALGAGRLAHFTVPTQNCDV